MCGSAMQAPRLIFPTYSFCNANAEVPCAKGKEESKNLSYQSQQDFTCCVGSRSATIESPDSDRHAQRQPRAKKSNDTHDRGSHQTPGLAQSRVLATPGQHIACDDDHDWSQ